MSSKNITKEEYDHAQQVWKVFNCKNLGDYHDVYLMCDVLLLSDIFENFRTTCMSSFQLDPAHYISLPGFTYSAMLKMTGVSKM